MSLHSIASTSTRSVFSSASASASVYASASAPVSRTQSVVDQRFESASLPGTLTPTVSMVSRGSSLSLATERAQPGALAWMLAYGLDKASLARMEPPALMVGEVAVYDDPQVCRAWREAQQYFRWSGGPGVLSGVGLAALVFEQPR